MPLSGSQLLIHPRDHGVFHHEIMVISNGFEKILKRESLISILYHEYTHN